MMSEQKYKQQRLIAVTMESLMPQDHFLRKLDETVDMSFIYDVMRPLYGMRGRPSIDPVVLVKMLLIGYLYGIDSERKLEQEIRVNIAYRWYLGLDLEERVPDHSTLSQNRRRRLKGNAIFEEIFLRIVRMCMDCGLVSGESIAMDSTHVKANADNNKRETVTVMQEPRAYLKKIEADVCALEAEKSSGKKRGAKPKQKNLDVRETEEVKSPADPDCGMLARPGKPKGFHYLCHQSADTKSGIITDIHVTAGNRNDHECCADRIKEQVSRGLAVKEFVGDKAYDVVEIHHSLTEMGILVYTAERPVNEGFRRSGIAVDQFLFDKEKNSYVCPGGEVLALSYYAREHGQIFAVYQSSERACKKCPHRPICFSATRKTRKLRRLYGVEYMEASRKLTGTKRYQYLQRRRRVVCEGNFAYMKDNSNLRRTRKRGLENATEHCLLCAIALNLRKLVKQTGYSSPYFFVDSLIILFFR